MEAILKEGLAQLGLDTGSIPALTEFSRRLLEKNQVMNLTAITEPADVARLHLLDCACLLTAADFRGKQVVDVGTGAGFPGIRPRCLRPPPACPGSPPPSAGRRSPAGAAAPRLPVR